MPADEVADKARSHLRIADRLLPGRITGFYVVGSAALGEYVPGRSDLDFVATVRDDMGEREERRLRLLHLLAGAQSATAGVAARRSPVTGTRNGVFVRERDLARPVSEIPPVASHTGYRFAPGKAFDVNPVVWKVLCEHGIAVRGPEPSGLGLDRQPELLRTWNLESLATYWRAWGESVSGGLSFSSRPRRFGRARMVAWGVLGAPRLHCTIATGQVIGKLSAARYAVDGIGRSHMSLSRRWRRRRRGWLRCGRGGASRQPC